MTYVQTVELLMIVSGISALLSLYCAGIALFARKSPHRTAMAITAIICGLLSGVTFQVAWSIGSNF